MGVAEAIHSMNLHGGVGGGATASASMSNAASNVYKGDGITQQVVDGARGASGGVSTTDTHVSAGGVGITAQRTIGKAATIRQRQAQAQASATNTKSIASGGGGGAGAATDSSLRERDNRKTGTMGSIGKGLDARKTKKVDQEFVQLKRQWEKAFGHAAAQEME